MYAFDIEDRIFGKSVGPDGLPLSGEAIREAVGKKAEESAVSNDDQLLNPDPISSDQTGQQGKVLSLPVDTEAEGQTGQSKEKMGVFPCLIRSTLP